MDKKIPLRMCIACRQMKPKPELTRVVKYNDTIAIDPSGKADGRGCYVCSQADCIAKCIKLKMLNKAFRCTVSNEVYDEIIQLKQNKGVH